MLDIKIRSCGEYDPGKLRRGFFVGCTSEMSDCVRLVELHNEKSLLSRFFERPQTRVKSMQDTFSKTESN